MKYTIFNPITGQIQSTMSFSDVETANLNLDGKSYIQGDYSSRDYYIDQTQPVQLPAKPQDELEYHFDWAAKVWTIDQDRSMSTVRQQRNNLLSTVDRINPVWYASLTQDQQQELVAYRQQLLDVPQQAGFPTDIVWPAKPTWL